MMFNARRLKMNRSAFSVLFVAAALAGNLHNATAQTINSTGQTASPGVVARRSAPATAAKPVAITRMAPQGVLQPTGLNPQRFNANLSRMIARTSGPNLAPLANQYGGPVQQPISVDPATRQTELRTLAAMRQRRGVVTREGNILDPATRENEIRTLTTMPERRGLVPGQANLPDAATSDTELRTLETVRERRAFGTNNQTLGTINPHRHITNRDPEAGPQRERREPLKDAPDKKWHNKKDHISHDEAFRRHWHEWHDRNWWHNHCETIVFVTTGYYFLDGSYWYPAYGYDPLQTYYDYDGPVYTYSNLLPDEVIANVQTALQDSGYYFGSITGSLSVDTRAAIANFQRDYGLPITGAIDEETVEALGLY